MADSENSRTLSPVTCRGLLSGTAVWLAGQTANVMSVSGVTAPAETDEQVLCLWRNWMAAHREVRAAVPGAAASGTSSGRGYRLSSR
jgi:hypothetical protein